MEREVAAMASRLESSVGLKRKVEYAVEYADYFRDVDINGGLVAIDTNGDPVPVDIYYHGWAKTKDGKGSGDIELPKTKGGEAVSGSKTKGGEAVSGSKTKGGKAESGSKKGGEAESGSKEDGSSTTAMPVRRRMIMAGSGKRTKIVKYRIEKSKKHLFNKKPIEFEDLSRCNEAFATALRKYHELERSILEQFETKGYAEYEREEEVTDDENPVSV